MESSRYIQKALEGLHKNKLNRIALTGDTNDSDIKLASVISSSELKRVEDRYINIIDRVSDSQIRNAVAKQKSTPYGGCYGGASTEALNFIQTISSDKDKLKGVIRGSHGDVFREALCMSLRQCASAYSGLCTGARY